MDMDENQFKLYFRMAKNLAFNLPDEKDRVKASKWIKKIEETTDTSAKRTKFHVIQLLLLSLQRKELVGPFEKPPRDDATLTSYKWSFQPSDIARLILRKEFERIGQPEVHVEMSGDLCEFVAYQEIPNFGTHFFYAFSPEHIQKWTNLDKDIIPKGLLNITVISSPDTSILRNSILENLTKRVQTENTPEYIQMKNDMKTNLYPAAIESCQIISDSELKTPENRRTVSDVIPPTTGHKLFERTMPAIELQEDRCARNKRSMMSKLPPRLRDRLTRKFVPAERRQYPDRDPDLARTPEIFRKDVHKIKHLRKYKPDEFLLSKNEKFRQAGEAFRDLQYIPPENARRSPGKKYIQKPCQLESDDDGTPVQDFNESQHIKDSFERSYNRMKQEKPQRQQPECQPPVRRNELLERLEQLKANQAKRVVFDDIDIDIETEEIAFDRFVWKELPEEDEEVTILDNTEMLYDDVFGEEQVCDVDVLPTPKPIQELEQAEILLDAEMQLDDIFGEDQIANPEAVFKDVAIEGEKIIMPKSGFPERGTYRVGKRLVALPGEEPIVQTYVEQTGNDKLFNESLLRNQNNTPPLDDSMINKILNEKLKKYKPGENAVPRTYGPWATKFITNIEKLERGEQLEEEEEPEMEICLPENDATETNNKFDGVCPIIKERSQQATNRFEHLKTQYERKQRRKQKQVIDQDLLEPYIYGTVPPDKLGPLDTSIPDSNKLAPPLLQKICVCAKDPFESFEKQLDQSLQFFKEDPCQMTDGSQGQKILLDSDFLNRRIEGDLPADDSLIGEDEMVFDDLSGISEYIPVQDALNQYNVERTASQSISGMEKMLDNLSSQSSELLSPSQIIPSAIGLSPGQRLRRTLDIVNKYRTKRSEKLPPSYEIPFTQLENESDPLSSDSIFMDITPKSDTDLWDTEKMDEMEKRLQVLRQEAEDHKIPREISPCVEYDTPTRELVKKISQVSGNVENLRKRYLTLLQQQQELNKYQQKSYSGTFRRPLPFLDNGVPQSEIEDIDDLFDISEKGESDICDDYDRYDPVLKQHIPAQKLEDTSMPEVDFIGDEIMQPQKVSSIYKCIDFPEEVESDTTESVQIPAAMYQQETCNETVRRVPDQINARRRLSYNESKNFESSQSAAQNIPGDICDETPKNISGTGARRRLVYEMSTNPECPSIPLNMSPRERIKLLIEQQPAVEVEMQPKTTEFSPLQFTTKVVPKQPHQLNDESFPDECPSEDMYENLGDLAHALYIPTEEEEDCEIEELNNSRRDVPNLSGPTPETPSQPKRTIQDGTPIGRTDILPGEEGFKWLANYVPFEQQVGAERMSRRSQRRESCPPQHEIKNQQQRPSQRQSRISQNQGTRKPSSTSLNQKQQRTQLRLSQQQQHARKSQQQPPLRQSQQKSQSNQCQPQLRESQQQPHLRQTEQQTQINCKSQQQQQLRQSQQQSQVMQSQQQSQIRQSQQQPQIRKSQQQPQVRKKLSQPQLRQSQQQPQLRQSQQQLRQSQPQQQVRQSQQLPQLRQSRQQPQSRQSQQQSRQSQQQSRQSQQRPYRKFSSDSLRSNESECLQRGQKPKFTKRSSASQSEINGSQQAQMRQRRQTSSDSLKENRNQGARQPSCVSINQRQQEQSQPRQSQEEPLVRQSQQDSQARQCQQESQVRQSRELSQLRQSRELSQARRSQQESRARQSQQESQPGHSQQEAQARHCEQEPLIRQSPELSQVRQSPELSQVRQSPELSQVRQSAELSQVRQSRELSQVRQSRELSQVRQSQQESQARQCQQESQERQIQQESQPRYSQQEAQPRYTQQEAQGRQCEQEPLIRQSRQKSQVRQSRELSQVRQSQQDAQTRQSQQESQTRQSQQESQTLQSQQDAQAPQCRELSQVRQQGSQVRQSRAPSQARYSQQEAQRRQCEQDPLIRQSRQKSQVRQRRELSQVRPSQQESQIRQSQQDAQAPQCRELSQNQRQSLTREGQQPSQVRKSQQQTQLEQRQYRQSGPLSALCASQRPNVPTSAKLDIISDRQNDKDILMRKSETVTKKEPPPKPIPRTTKSFVPRKKLAYSSSGNLVEQLGETTASTQIRKLTSGAVGQCGRSLVEKSSMTVTKDYGKKSQKIVKASEVKYKNPKEERTKEYTFATRK